MAFLTVLAAAGPAPGFVLGPIVTDTELGAGTLIESGPAMLQGAVPEWLPAGRDVCASLGLDRETPAGCTLAGIMNASAPQTDPALWFSAALSMVDAPLSDCHEPKAIQTYRTVAGSVGTTYLCRPSDAEDHISEAALDALRSRVKALNRADPPTFGQHQSAKYVKLFIDLYTKSASQSR